MADMYRKKILLFGVLAALTLLFTVFHDPYREVGPELLTNADFRDGLTGWQYPVGDGAVSLQHPDMVGLRADDFKRQISLTQVIPEPDRFEFLRLSGDLRTENVVAGQRGWQKARLILGSHDLAGQWLPAPHHVVLLTGTQSWGSYSQVFKVIPAAGQLRVSAQLPRATGTMWVRNISLRQVVEKSSTAYFQTGFLILWGIFLAWLMIPLVAQGRIPALRGMVFLSLFAVLLGTLSPGAQKIQWQKDSAQVLQKIVEHSVEPQATQAAKTSTEKKRLFNLLQSATEWGHLLLFVLLGLALPAALPFVGLKRLAVDLSMLAGATEMMQFFIQGRTPLFKDFAIDLTGIVLAFSAFLVWQKMQKRQEDFDPSAP